ncbi:hypothetical protein IAR55_006866 [Kwoniella newhampshirensis]|uniref:Symplekin C-terminal domain-containing protein n=1 Tax=Kwoniella newhampshirensis TaxID=1651941 RepID=A0AAW0YQT6_9TREE
MEIRAVEKTMRMVMTHVLRHPPFAAFAAQLNDALVRQKQRMDIAFQAELQARKDRKKGLKQTLKHPMEAESSEQAAKRARLEVQPGVGLGRGPEVDVTTLPVEAVIDAVMTGLEVVPPDLLTRAFENARRALAENTGDAIPLMAAALGVIKEEVKDEDEEEIMNPLDMDLDDEDLLLEQPDVQEEENIAFTDFVLPPPETLDPSEKDFVMDSAMQRIWTIGSDLATLPDPKESDAVKTAVQPKEMWMLLLARLATRSADVKRKAICDFVATDFISRSKFASVWLNEEWYNDKIGVTSSRQYAANLDAIITAYLPRVDVKDKSLAAFILTLPEIPASVIAMLETICQDTDRNVVGFLSLRDIIESRPPVRQIALRTLLELCTHPDRKVRVMAIITVIRRWGQDSPMMPSLIKFALGILWRLADGVDEGEEDAKAEDVVMEEGEQTEEKVTSKFLGEVSPETVQQYVELAFALSKRQQGMLDDIFRLYPKLAQPIQDAVEAQLMPLIQSMGPSEKLLEILKAFPAGSEKLVMKVVALLSSEGASPVLVSLIKGLLSERELDPRFVVPIVGDLDKAEIEKQLPRIVSLLGDADSKDMVRTAFASMLQKMTPADLLVALHQEGAALKLTIEAIGICFAMTTVFRSDVLANAMSRIAELPTLPVVLMRTMIQVVTTYKSLIPFVSNHILPKLITKKIWETPQLWEGFVRLARITAPASYGALLQLPREHLRDLLEKQPAMKAGLKSFLASKPGSKAALVEIFGEES